MPDFAIAPDSRIEQVPSAGRAVRNAFARSGLDNQFTATWPTGIKVALSVMDAIAIFSALVLTYLLAFGADLNARVAGTKYVTHHMVSAIVAVTWMLFLAAAESRRSRYLGAGVEEYRRVIKASLQTFGTLAILSYLLRYDVSRLLFATLLPTGMIFVLFGRWLARSFLTKARLKGHALIPTVVVGDEREVPQTLRDLSQNPGAGYNPVAVCITGSDAADDEWPEFEGRRVVSQAELSQFVGQYPLSAVVVTGGISRNAVRRLSWRLESSRTRLLFVPSLTDVAGPRMSFQMAAGVNLVHVELPKYSGGKYWAKRIFDIGFSALALCALSPLLAVIALAIKVDGGGPVLFRQQRVGLQGAHFTMHKFRTMHVNAEARLAELRSRSIGSGPLFKMDTDPRVTRFGRFLRKHSLDELPQFWTVLRGDMSIVGPRPHLAEELAEFPPEALRRLLIKPGITGLWQIGGRSHLGIEDAIRLDLRYVENWSLAGDISIILKTIRTVLRPTGAY